MAGKIISKSNWGQFVNSLIRQSGEVFGVKPKDTKYDFGKLSNSNELCLDYDVTLLPPKKYFLPPYDKLVTFSRNRADNTAFTTEPSIEDTRRVIIGVHPYDIKGLTTLDAVFATTDPPDTNYTARRQNTIIIGINCLNPSPTAFAASIDCHTVNSGFDLMLTDIGAGYTITIGTTAGEQLLNKYAITSDATPTELAEAAHLIQASADKYQTALAIPLTEIPALLEQHYENPVWQELGNKCLSCGSCVMVCPTCFCYDVQDKTSPSLTNVERYRSWDACVLTDYALIASGENFRPDAISRLKHRYYCKGKYMLARYGQPGCVGCGRCVTACLPDIASPAATYNKIIEGQVK